MSPQGACAGSILQRAIHGGGFVVGCCDTVTGRRHAFQKCHSCEKCEELIQFTLKYLAVLSHGTKEIVGVTKPEDGLPLYRRLRQSAILPSLFYGGFEDVPTCEAQ